jgi:hypothetical protein
MPYLSSREVYQEEFEPEKFCLNISEVSRWRQDLSLEHRCSG